MSSRLSPTGARELINVDAKDVAQYSPLAFSLPHLTAYSISWLALWEIPTTYENISVLNARLFPTEFALSGFPDFPDAMRTNRTLLQMRPKYRGFATSDPRRGVFLTEKGKDAAAKVFTAIGPPTIGRKPLPGEIVPVSHPPATRRQYTRNPAQIIASAKSKLLYRRYKEGTVAETDVVHLLGLLAMYDHSPPKEVKKAFRQLRADAQTVQDPDFLTFLEKMEERFHSYLNRADPK